MDYRRATPRRLDDEHRAAAALLGRLEHAVRELPAGGGPAPAFAPLARHVAEHVRGPMDRHFRYEEEVLFPHLADAGEGEMARLLAEEHASIRALAADLVPRLDAAAAGRLDAAGYAALRPCALAFVEMLSAHIAMETAGLVALLDGLLDDDADRTLAFDEAYR